MNEIITEVQELSRALGLPVIPIEAEKQNYSER